jgi:SLT domain-containing protein
MSSCEVLAELGIGAAALNGVLNIIQHESGGNPSAINLTDSNAKAGHPSQGLMQTIPSTFAAYAGPYRSLGILNPLANIYAGINYALHRYGAAWLTHGGNVGKLGGYAGYKLGTDFVPEDGMAYLHRGEAVVPAAQNQGAPYTGPGEATFHLYDADGVLLGSMRGHAEAAAASAMTAQYNRGAY